MGGVDSAPKRALVVSALFVLGGCTFEMVRDPSWAQRAASAQEGVAESESKMIDAPVVAQAQRILRSLDDPA